MITAERHVRNFGKNKKELALVLGVILTLSPLVTFGYFKLAFGPAVSVENSGFIKQTSRDLGGARLAFLQQTAGVSVNPSAVIVFKNKTFGVNVTITNVSNLCGWQFELYWSNAVLNCTNATIQTPSVWQNQSFNFSPSPSFNNSFNSTQGRLFNAVACLWPAPPFSGSTTIATLTFNAIQAGNTSLSLVNVKLGDDNAYPITYIASNGYASIYNPMCAMKTLASGYFYIPNLNVTILKIEFLFNDTLVADQTGGSSPYQNITRWPDGVVDLYDAQLVSGHMNQREGNANWEYMADIVPDGVIDIYDAMKVSGHYGNTGTYVTNLTGVNVTFNVGNPIAPDSGGYVQIPQNATSFTVYKNGNTTGALIVFGKS